MRLKKLVKSLIIWLTAFIMMECNKPPKADFTTDKDQYTAGEVIHITNKSLHAVTYNWLFPDLSVSHSKNPEYTLNADLDDGSFPIRLESLSKTENSLITKTLTIESQKGQVTVWTSDSVVKQNNKNVQVWIDNNFIGNITTQYNSEPTCGADGCITVNIKKGTHTIYVYNPFNDNSRTDNIIIVKDMCTKFKLSKK